MISMKQIDKLIIKSSHQELIHYWHYDRIHCTFEEMEGTFPDRCVVATISCR